MNDLRVTGRQRFMGLEIPVVLGGFGEGKKCIADKTIAAIHGMEVKHVRELINRNIKRFEGGKDILDLKVVVLNDNKKDMGEGHDILLFELGYTQMQISKAEHIYVLSERGYAKLIKIMDTDLAWKVHDKLIDEYFELREQCRLTPEEMLRIQLGMLDKQSERLGGVEIRMDKLEHTMTIDYGQQQELQALAKSVAVGAVGGKKARAYTYQYPQVDENVRSPKLYGMVISRLWHDYQDYFGVNSYKNTPMVRFDEALEYINGWVPPTNMQLEIGKINRGEI